MIFSPQVAITLNAEESAWLVQILLTAYHSEDVECGLDEMQAAFALRLLAGFGVEPEDEISGEEPIDPEHKLHQERT